MLPDALFQLGMVSVQLNTSQTDNPDNRFRSEARLRESRKHRSPDALLARALPYAGCYPCWSSRDDAP